MPKIKYWRIFPRNKDYDLSNIKNNNQQSISFVSKNIMGRDQRLMC